MSVSVNGRGRHSRDRMVDGFTQSMQSLSTTTKLLSYEFRSWRDVLDATLCDKVWQWPQRCSWNIVENGFKHSIKPNKSSATFFIFSRLSLKSFIIFQSVCIIKSYNTLAIYLLFQNQKWSINRREKNLKIPKGNQNP